MIGTLELVRGDGRQRAHLVAVGGEACTRGGVDAPKCGCIEGAHLAVDIRPVCVLATDGAGARGSSHWGHQQAPHSLILWRGHVRRCVFRCHQKYAVGLRFRCKSDIPAAKTKAPADYVARLTV